MSQDIVFRVSGLPSLATISTLETAFREEFGDQATIDLKKSTLCPSCFGDNTQVALVQFTKEPPKELSTLKVGNSYDMELNDGDISVDKDFYGLTQLYPTSGAIVADVVAVCGLNGHAYESWGSRGNLRRMWLRHFFSQDVPSYRTMIYGYNSSLAAHAVHTTQDYSKGFLEELMKARQTNQEKKRPLVFIGHSFGGVIIVQSLVRAKESDSGSDQSMIFPATYTTIFFGTPHRGLVVDDIRASLEEGSSRHALLDSIEKGAALLASELSRFIDYCNDIKIVNFYETHQTRKLVREADGKLSRSGEYFTAVESESSVLQLPRKIAESLPVDGDQSDMVKFSGRNTSKPYTSVLKRLRNVATTAGASNHFHTAYAAVLGQDAEALRHILRSRPVAVNERQKGGSTMLLHLSIENGGDREVITTLLDYQVSLDSVDLKGMTPLYLAASKGYTEVVEILAKNGADANAVCERMTPLHAATLGGHKDVVSKLCSCNADIEAVVNDEEGFTALHLAAGSGNIEIATVLLSRGAKIEARGKGKDTPLHCAARNGHVEMIELLIEHSAEVMATGVNDDTALHFATSPGHVAAMETLIDRGADIHAKNTHGHTALHIAAGAGLMQVVGLLLLREADLKSVDNHQNTPLHFAAQNGYDQVVELLLKGDASTVNTRDNNGYTALHTAAWAGHLSVVEVLLRYNADVQAIEEVNRYKPHHLARLGQHKEVEAFLLRQKPKPLTPAENR